MTFLPQLFRIYLSSGATTVMEVGKGKMCVGELIHLILSSLSRHIDVYWDVHHALWPSIIFLVDNLRDILCSCQNGLLRSGALFLFMVGNNFVVSRLHLGKRNGYFAPFKILTTAHSPYLWILSFNHYLLASQARVPVFGEVSVY